MLFAAAADEGWPAHERGERSQPPDQRHHQPRRRVEARAANEPLRRFHNHGDAPTLLDGPY